MLTISMISLLFITLFREVVMKTEGKAGFYEFRRIQFAATFHGYCRVHDVHSHDVLVYEPNCFMLHP